MNRELKFRVYIPNHEKFCYFSLGDFDYSDRYLHQHQYPVQQYTGLQDKNGKEIYEGDIVLLQEKGFNGEPSTLKHLCEIFVKQPPNSSWFFHARPLPVDDNGRQFSLYNQEYEVIGNIFENPELLK